MGQTPPAVPQAPLQASQPVFCSISSKVCSFVAAAIVFQFSGSGRQAVQYLGNSSDCSLCSWTLAEDWTLDTGHWQTGRLAQLEWQHLNLDQARIQRQRQRHPWTGLDLIAPQRPIEPNLFLPLPSFPIRDEPAKPPISTPKQH